MTASATQAQSTLPTDPAHHSVAALASENIWLDMLHYHRVGLVSTYISPYVSKVESQVDDPVFFLSDTGASDPLSELEATLAAFRTDHKRVVSGSMTADDAAQCRFPARFHWLASRLPELEGLQLDCEAFNDWAKEIDGKGITIVFPAAFINSPSSMFGHTLIRIDREPGSNPLLAYAVNYAANADPRDDPLLFSVKGLVGGYPGVVSIVPYYEKVKEYHFLESRNVWEYALDVDQAEVDQFVRHVWEMKSVRIDYFFLNENCSYQLLTLLDASSKRFNFADTFSVGVIPGDTVRVLAEAGLVSSTEFRASAATELETFSDGLSEEQLASIERFMDDESADTAEWIDSLKTDGLVADDEELGLLLDTAYRYARFLSARLKSAAPGLGRKSIQLLSQRSRLGDTGPIPDSPVPSLRDDQGHGTQRIGAAAGYASDEAYVDVMIRSSFHDLLDPAGGYPEGASLEMFALRLRQAMGRDAGLRIHELTFIDIDSRAALQALSRPSSWGVAFGLNREATYERLSPYFRGSIGLSQQIGESGWLVTGSLAGNLRAHDNIDKGFALAAGPELSLLRQSDAVSFMLTAGQSFRLAGRRTDPSAVEAELAFHLSRSFQLRTGASYEDDSPAEGWNGRLGLFYAY